MTKSFREIYRTVHNSPQAVERRRKGRFKALAVLVFGLPFALILVTICEGMHWPRSTYFPITMLIMLFLSNAFGAYLNSRKSS
jgi:hypothetical protein